MSDQPEDIKVTVICWKCDKKFKVLLSAIKRKRVVYLNDQGVEIGQQLVLPKAYSVPCPFCGAENEVMLP